MLKKILLLLIIFSINSSLAEQSEHVIFEAKNSTYKSVDANAARVLATDIIPSTGELENDLSLGFVVTSNGRDPVTLYLTAIAETQSGWTNAMFSTSGAGYNYGLALANADKFPTLSAFNNAKNSPSSADGNANVISYYTENLQKSSSNVTVNYDTTNNRWVVNVNRFGIYSVRYTIPSAVVPVSNTYGSNDATGRYQATIIMSFI